MPHILVKVPQQFVNINNEFFIKRKKRTQITRSLPVKLILPILDWFIKDMEILLAEWKYKIALGKKELLYGMAYATLIRRNSKGNSDKTIPKLVFSKVLRNL